MKYFLLILLLVFTTPALAKDDDDCSSIDTEFKMYDCLASHYEDTEQKLMAVYNQALYQIEKAEEKRENQKKLKKLFQDSHQNWIAYRETACLAETFNIEDEKKIPLMMRLCYMRLADRRTEDIQKNFKTWEKRSKNK